MGATIEDAKVSADEFLDKLREELYPDEIQSIDIVTFQKV